MTPTIFGLVLLSSTLHAAWNVAAKRVSGNVGIIWLGQVASAIVLLPFAAYFGHVLPESWVECRYIVLTGVMQAVYFLLLSKGYQHGDISVVYPIGRGLGVAGTALAAALIIGEDLSGFGVFGILAICAGTLTLGLAKGTPEDRTALKFAGAIGLTLAAGAVNDKYAVGVLHPVVYMFWMFALAAAASAPFILTRSKEKVRTAMRTQKRYVALIGYGSLVSYLIILFVLREGPMAYVVAMRELSVVLGSLWGFFVWKEAMTSRRVLGIAAILVGLVLIRLA